MGWRAAESSVLSLVLLSLFTVSCGEDSVEPDGSGAEGRSVADADTVSARAAAIKAVLSDNLRLAITGDVYGVSSTCARVVVRYNAPAEKLQASQLVLLMTDNPKKELAFGKGCKEVYINHRWLDEDGVCVLYVNGLVAQSTYRYRLYYRYNTAEEAFGDVLVFETALPDKFTAEAVDLGLSVKWASCNLGATRPYQSGVYYFYGQPDSEAGKTSSASLPSGDIAGSDSDPATVELGSGWTSPTQKQLVELINQCDWKTGEENGVEGYKVYGRGDYYGNFIFIPFAGYYNSNSVFLARGASFMLWSGQTSSSSDKAIALTLNADGSCSAVRCGKTYRMPIRPVFAQ